MTVRVTLDVEIDASGLAASDIVDRLKCVDYDSVLSDSFDYALDEFGEVENVELYDVEAV